MRARLDLWGQLSHSCHMTFQRQILAQPADLLQACRKQPALRIAPFDYGGERYWGKRPERLTSLMRLQKGDALASFQREVALLQAFYDHGAPVVPVLAAEPDLIVLPDMGPSLAALGHELSVSELAPILQQAARALAQMHSQGMAHGRPGLRDIVWTGSEICFLDLEAGARLQASVLRRARDVVLLILSVFEHKAGLAALAPAMLDAYAQQDRAAILPAARKLARLLRPLRWLAAPVAARDRKRGKPSSEALAIAPTLSLLA